MDGKRGLLDACRQADVSAHPPSGVCAFKSHSVARLIILSVDGFDTFKEFNPRRTLLVP